MKYVLKLQARKSGSRSKRPNFRSQISCQKQGLPKNLLGGFIIHGERLTCQKGVCSYLGKLHENCVHVSFRHGNYSNAV